MTEPFDVCELPPASAARLRALAENNQRRADDMTKTAGDMILNAARLRAEAATLRARAAEIEAAGIPASAEHREKLTGGANMEPAR